MTVPPTKISSETSARQIMEIEVLDEEPLKARYRKRSAQKLVDVSLPEEVWVHLGLKDKGELGFKRVRYKGKNYILVGVIMTVM